MTDADDTGNRFNFTKSALGALPFAVDGTRAIYHDANKGAGGLSIRVTRTRKTFFVRKRVNGKSERVTLGEFPGMSIEQARKAAAAANAEFAKGISPAEKRKLAREEMTLQDLFDAYLERKAANNKRPDKVRDIFRLYLSHWAMRKLSRITHEHVSSLHTKIGREKGKPTANQVLALLHVMFNKAINTWHIWKGDNPAHGLEKFPEKSRDRFLQADELPRFFEALGKEPNETIRDYVLVSLLTGARKSNVLAMAWDDINLERATWRIPDTKNSTPHTVTLSPEMVELLNTRKAASTSPYVFPGEGRQGHLMEPKLGWKRILERAELSDLRIHDLRRTLGSWQAKSGASLSIIGKSLNHKNISTTQIYARLDLDPVRESVDKATTAMLTAAGLKPPGDVIELKKRR